MALLRANFTDYQKLSFNLSTDTLRKLNAYARFLGSTSGKADQSAKLDEVVDQALNYVFTRDTDFKKFLAQHGDAPIVHNSVTRKITKKVKAAIES